MNPSMNGGIYRVVDNILGWGAGGPEFVPHIPLKVDYSFTR